MMDNSKVQSTHTRRAAVVYIRQSHPSQVENNRESTARQYALVEKAIALGWAQSQVTTIDEDLGVSGKVFVKRSRFDHLNAEVALGRVGILLGLEVSRLARSNADWYRLLDMRAITDTLLADSNGVYNPALFNDRLILGLKGTRSEAELHILRGRLDGGIRNKAARGLGKEWETRLQNLAKAEAELFRQKQQRPRRLTDEEHKRVKTLGSDLRLVWTAPTTTARDRNELLRTLLEEVILKVERKESHADLTLRWRGQHDYKACCALEALSSARANHR